MAKHPFVSDRDAFEALGERTVRMLGAYLRDFAGRAGRPGGADRTVRQRLIALPLPEHGQSPEEILDFLQREIMPWPIATGHKRSYGWVNSRPGADRAAGGRGRQHDGLRAGRVRSLRHLPDEERRGAGSWSWSGSRPRAACACCSAADRRQRSTRSPRRAIAPPRATAGTCAPKGLQSGRKRLILYSSAESHSSIQKCAEQLGIGTDNLRAIEADDCISACSRRRCARRSRRT